MTNTHQNPISESKHPNHSVNPEASNSTRGWCGTAHHVGLNVTHGVCGVNDPIRLRPNAQSKQQQTTFRAPSVGYSNYMLLQCAMLRNTAFSDNPACKQRTHLTRCSAPRGSALRSRASIRAAAVAGAHVARLPSPMILEQTPTTSGD